MLARGTEDFSFRVQRNEISNSVVFLCTLQWLWCLKEFMGNGELACENSGGSTQLFTLTLYTISYRVNLNFNQEQDLTKAHA